MELTENGPWSLAEYWREKGSYAADCVLELRARVEALEAAEQHQDKLDRLIEQDRAASADAQPSPASSLVERLEAVGYGRTHARAAIREVAAAAHVVCPFDPVENPAEHEGWSDMICWLEQEANR